MTPEDILLIHKRLWALEPPATISFEGRNYPVIVVKNAQKNFRLVKIKGRTIITQNLRKQSSNTDWCLKNPSNWITWVISPQNEYVGMVRSYRRQNKRHHEVKHLRQKKILLSIEE